MFKTREENVIQFLKSWCEGILVAVMISIMIEAILPEGNNKKYVKVIIGIYLIFTILSPFLGKLNTNFEWKNNFDLATVETATVDTQNIQTLYLNGIQETMKNNIEEEFEVKVENLEILYDENYENIEKVTLQIIQDGVLQVEKVEIGNQTEQETSNPAYDEIRNYISENYELEKSNIIIR